jgi:hypothetical protein
MVDSLRVIVGYLSYDDKNKQGIATYEISILHFLKMPIHIGDASPRTKRDETHRDFIEPVRKSLELSGHIPPQIRPYAGGKENVQK